MESAETLTAYHEAGHAVMSILMGGHVNRVSIDPPNDNGPNRYGETITTWPRMSDSQRFAYEICVSLAGPIAESLYAGCDRPIETVAEWQMDWDTAIQIASQVAVGKSAVNKLLNECQVKIRHLFDQANSWAAVAAIADELLAHETIEHSQVAEAVAFWL